MTKADEKQPHSPPVRPRHPWRDTIEGVLGALVLVLIIRHFVFEVFRIPTGSMAPTLLGQHRDLKCPNCGLEFPVDAEPGQVSSGSRRHLPQLQVRISAVGRPEDVLHLLPVVAAVPIRRRRQPRDRGQVHVGLSGGRAREALLPQRPSSRIFAAETLGCDRLPAVPSRTCAAGPAAQSKRACG